MTVEDAS